MTGEIRTKKGLVWITEHMVVCVTKIRSIRKGASLGNKDHDKSGKCQWVQ